MRDFYGRLLLQNDILYYGGGDASYSRIASQLDLFHIQENKWTSIALDEIGMDIPPHLQQLVKVAMNVLREPVPLANSVVKQFGSAECIPFLPCWQQRRPEIIFYEGKLLFIGGINIVKLSPTDLNDYPFTIFQNQCVVTAWNPVTNRRTLVTVLAKNRSHLTPFVF
jgi:hypothetical protein